MIMNVARLVPRSRRLSQVVSAGMRKVPGPRPTTVTHPSAQPAMSSIPRTFLSTSAPRSSAKNSNADPSDAFITALNQNKEWAAQTAKQDPELFPTNAAGQRPQILWIGCSDSRVPETSVLGMKPGDIFAHRNIANILHAADLSSAAVIEFAVRHLRVQHVVLSGHTSCGGVAAALGNKNLGILDPWLLPLRQIREQNLGLLQSLSPDEANLKLVELNVLEGVKALKQKSVVLEAIQERGLQVHGVVYDVGSGVVRELETKESEEVDKGREVSYKTEA